jgi:predicted polyphosphate/ATP-dependent NAD kinase
MPLFRIGLIVNPYAGIGGAVALKGSDGPEIREQAIKIGAELKANDKTRLALEEILALQDQLEIFTAAGQMGEDIARELGFVHQVVYRPENEQTEGLDTELAASAMLQQKLDLLLFSGGDGTARNICKVVENKLPVLGVPAGCKIHSGVYGITPQAAGRVVAMLVRREIVTLQDAEVMDIDEDLFRQGKVNARHYGEMRVPSELSYIQAVKSGGKESEELVLMDIAAHVIEYMENEPGTLFIMGSGSTVARVMQELGVTNTLLGVDVLRNKQCIGADLRADELLKLVQYAPAKLVITLIGGQGHVFGRGNQQLSPEVLKNIGLENIRVIATKGKLQSLDGKALIADTGDIALDAELAGVIPVITGYHDQVLYPVGRFE